MTDTHTPMPNLDITCAQTHSHISGRFFYSTSRSSSWHTHMCTGDLFNDDTHTHTHTHTHVSLHYTTHISLSRLQERFSCTHAALHATGVLISSVWRVFLVETVVLQTVLWDIRAWSARFLVLYCFIRLWQHCERILFLNFVICLLIIQVEIHFDILVFFKIHYKFLIRIKTWIFVTSMFIAIRHTVITNAVLFWLFSCWGFPSNF